jgi:hypothetical protein
MVAFARKKQTVPGDKPLILALKKPDPYLTLGGVQLL